ncbi:hypothetical protein MAMC_00926 [Methylacidimicrobium cyclopophantes]|uniref:Filamentous haemagglutinin FhaB/tRNA nuclease CdiA-like TPS domain-containing protein n=1 Tax=Methylacidimicrobium cyclopophantes TaxID=1041766 RepID=A0A5E6MIY5_9BACT|nr:hypothetical protein [Methylacidimicrobium cyclopophantes]VVM06026.1 hypothetical protein MAMC_00926 [Methylacidimicrobium cyclopophantes]
MEDRVKKKSNGNLSVWRAALLTAALAGLAGFGIGSARATVVAPLQLPGHGSVVAGSATATGVYGAGGTGHILVGANDTVINWGNTGGSIGTNQPGGFNIGGSAHLVITGAAGLSLLNVDVSGSPSQIFGLLNTNINTFVANANGITVGPGATIVAPAGIGLIAATVNAAQFAANGTLPISFTAGGPLNVQGDLVAAGGPGHSIILAGSGAVNISPIPNGADHYFKPGTNVTVIGGVGGVVSGGAFTPMDSLGSSTPSASTPTTVTLNLGSSAHPYDLRLSGPNGTVPSVGTMVLANGNIVNDGVLSTSTTYHGIPNALPALQWTGTLTNNGTILAELNSAVTGGRVSFYGNTSALLPYGGLVNNGTIAQNVAGRFVVNLPGTIVNSSGATISNVGGQVALWAGSAALPVLPVSGAVINQGSIASSDGIALVASNPNHVGPNPGGGVFSNGTLQFVDGNAFADGAYLNVRSLTGNAFLGGSISVADPNGLATALLQSGSPGGVFVLAANLTAGSVTFTGGSLTGGATITTNTLALTDFTGNVNHRVGTNALLNGFTVANGSSGNTVILLDMPTTADGAIGPQAVNLAIHGNATIHSGGSSTFVNSLGSTGVLPTEANVGSQLLIQTSGNLTVASSVHGPEDSALSSLALGVHGFVFPGGIVLLSGYSNGVLTNPSAVLTLNTVVDNGYAPTVPGGQGIFFQAPTIVTAAPVITNGNAWVNFSTAPSIVPAIYGVAPATNISPTAYTIVADPSAYHVRPFVP